MSWLMGISKGVSELFLAWKDLKLGFLDNLKTRNLKLNQKESLEKLIKNLNLLIANELKKNLTINKSLTLLR